MHRARIPNALFKDIIGDIEIVLKQYGPPMDHENKKAMSRLLAPVSVSIMFHNIILDAGRSSIELLLCLVY